MGEDSVRAQISMHCALVADVHGISCGMMVEGFSMETCDVWFGWRLEITADDDQQRDVA